MIILVLYKAMRKEKGANTIAWGCCTNAEKNCKTDTGRERRYISRGRPKQHFGFKFHFLFHSTSIITSAYYIRIFTMENIFIWAYLMKNIVCQKRAF